MQQLQRKKSAAKTTNITKRKPPPEPPRFHDAPPAATTAAPAATNAAPQQCTSPTNARVVNSGSGKLVGSADSHLWRSVNSQGLMAAGTLQSSPAVSGAHLRLLRECCAGFSGQSRCHQRFVPFSSNNLFIAASIGTKPYKVSALNHASRAAVETAGRQVSSAAKQASSCGPAVATAFQADTAIDTSLASTGAIAHESSQLSGDIAEADGASGSLVGNAAKLVSDGGSAGDVYDDVCEGSGSHGQINAEGSWGAQDRGYKYDSTYESAYADSVDVLAQQPVTQHPVSFSAWQEDAASLRDMPPFVGEENVRGSRDARGSGVGANVGIKRRTSGRLTRSPSSTSLQASHDLGRVLVRRCLRLKWHSTPPLVWPSGLEHWP